MNKKFYKDFRYRQKYHPINHIMIKTLRNTPSLYKYKRHIILLKRLYRKRIHCKFHNFCFLSGRSRGVYRYFNLGRNFLKSYINAGEIPGWRKHSW